MEVELEELVTHGPSGAITTVIATVVINSVLGGEFVPRVSAMAMGTAGKTRDRAVIEALEILMDKLFKKEVEFNDKWKRTINDGNGGRKEYKEARDVYEKFHNFVRDEWVSLKKRGEG